MQTSIPTTSLVDSLIVHLTVLLRFRRHLHSGGHSLGCGSRSLRNDSVSRLFGISQDGVDLGLVLFEKVLQERLVQELGTLRLWQHGPQKEGKFEGIPEGDPVEQKVDKDLQDRKGGVDDPVDQPLRIFRPVLALNGLEGLEGGVDESDNAAEGASTDSKEDEQDKQHEAAQHQEFLRDLDDIL